MEHWVYSDGLASVSIFIETADANRALDGTSSIGAVNAYGRRIDNYQVTVVGEVLRQLLSGWRIPLLANGNGRVMRTEEFYCDEA